MSAEGSYAISIPLEGVTLADHEQLIRELPSLGYTAAWSAEANGADAFTPLALTSTWAPQIRLGTGIAQVFTRGPGILAMHIASLCELAPGRVDIGIGSSSDVIVENWNGIPFVDPYKRVRDVTLFLRQALTGEKVDQRYDTFEIHGFRLTRPVAVMPKIYIAALRQGMLRLAGRVGDGAVVNWLSAEDVPKVAKEVAKGGGGRDIVARIYVIPTPDRDIAMNIGRMIIAWYMNVPVYRQFQEWVGRGELFKEMWDAWESGDRKAALAAIPEQAVDELIVHGTPDECRAHIQRYVDAGVTIPIVGLVSSGNDAVRAVRDLAPYPVGN